MSDDALFSEAEVYDGDLCSSCDDRFQMALEIPA